MKIKIPSRNNIPECELDIEVLKKSSESQLEHKRPIMLVLPGGPGGNKTVYDEIKYFLFEFADLILIDPRGCGLSSPSEAHFCTMEESVNDIEALRKELSIEKFILLGGSYGAMIALKYAISHSKNLLSLILLSGAASGKCFDTALETLKNIGTTEQIRLTEKLFSGKIESTEEKEKYYSIMKNIYLAKKIETISTETQIPTIAKKIPYFLELSNLGHSKLLPNYDVTHELCKINTPTLLLAGEYDWINNVKYAHEMHKSILNSELIVFPKAGHFIWKGIEKQFFEEIKKFTLKNSIS